MTTVMKSAAWAQTECARSQAGRWEGHSHEPLGDLDEFPSSRLRSLTRMLATPIAPAVQRLAVLALKYPALLPLA
jgi:hypothetical protein